MKSGVKIALVALIVSLSEMTYAQRNLLCFQDKVSVYYTVVKTFDGVEDDEWLVELEIFNEAPYDLYYKARYKELELAKTVEGKSLLAPYLEVRVMNKTGGDYDYPYYVNGQATLQITTDSTSILKVSTARHLKSFRVKVKKTQIPILQGEFTEKLMSLDELRKKKRKKKG
jgi:hypothetical protein